MSGKHRCCLYVFKKDPRTCSTSRIVHVRYSPMTSEVCSCILLRTRPYHHHYDTRHDFWSKCTTFSSSSRIVPGFDWWFIAAVNLSPDAISRRKCGREETDDNDARQEFWSKCTTLTSRSCIVAGNGFSSTLLISLVLVYFFDSHLFFSFCFCYGCSWCRCRCECCGYCCCFHNRLNCF